MSIRSENPEDPKRAGEGARPSIFERLRVMLGIAPKGTTLRNDDAVNLFSSRGPTRGGYVDTHGVRVADNLLKPDLVAPGKDTLLVIVPLTIAAIFFLLFMLFKSLRLAALIILVLPFASIGGVFGLFFAGEYLSVPAAVGFINLWGIAVLNGVVLISFIKQLREDGYSMEEALLHGCGHRFRPVMMTASVAMLALVPMLFSGGPGSEVTRPLAAVVIAGLITSTALTLLVLPVLYRWFEEKEVEA